MKKLAAIAAASLVIAAFTVDAASARHRHRGYHQHYSSHYYGGREGSSHYGSYGMYRGGSWGNSAMSGNNGNSGGGSNSLGHIQGGNIGGGK